MAKIGLSNFRFALAEIRSGGNIVAYHEARTFGKAISCNVSITSNDAKLFANDVLAESDTSFQSGTVTLGIDNDDLQSIAALLGHEYDSETGEIIRNENDVAPYVGVGRIVTLMQGGVLRYKVEILFLVKFSEPSEENSTKGESVEFGTTEIEGTISTLAGGQWNTAKYFSDKATAISALNQFFNVGIFPPRPRP